MEDVPEYYDGLEHRRPDGCWNAVLNINRTKQVVFQKRPTPPAGWSNYMFFSFPEERDGSIRCFEM